MRSNVERIVLSLTYIAFLSACDPHNIRDDRVVDIKSAEGLAELGLVVEAVQTAVLRTSDAFPSRPRKDLADQIDQQCTTARTAAKLKCDADFASAGEECTKLTGSALEARCTARLAVAERTCEQAQKTLKVASLCSKGDALSGVTIQKATLSLDTARITESGGAFKFLVLKFGASKSFKEVQHLDLVFTPVPAVDPTGARAETLGIDLSLLNNEVKRVQSLRGLKLPVNLLGRDDLIKHRNALLEKDKSGSSQGLINAEPLITFIRGAAAAASIEKIDGRDAALITNSFKVAFTFEVTKKGELGLEWELAPNSAVLNAGRIATAGNQLTLEFGQPE